MSVSIFNVARACSVHIVVRVAFALVPWFGLACSGVNLSAIEVRPHPTEHVDTPVLRYDRPTRGLEGIRTLTDSKSTVEELPFDGTVLDMGMSIDWLHLQLIEGDYQEQVDRLRTAHFQKLVANFQLLAFDTIDWTDDAAANLAIANARTVANLANAAGLSGIFLDTQQYGNIFWMCPTSAVPCEDLLERRGHDFMSALVAGFPNITVLLSLAHGELFVSTCLLGDGLGQSAVGGLPAFLDGMEIARAESRLPVSLVDAFLGSYPTRNPAAFELYYHLIHFDWNALASSWIPGIVTYEFPPTDPDLSAGARLWPDMAETHCSDVDRLKVSRDRSAAFGLSLDYDAWNRGGFQTDASRFDQNYRTPDEFEAVVEGALGIADRYVWIWSGTMTFSDVPGSPRVPPAYVDAIAHARAKNHR